MNVLKKMLVKRMVRKKVKVARKKVKKVYQTISHEVNAKFVR